MPRKRLNIRVKLLNRNAKAPARSHSTDAGWDLFCTARVTLAPGETKTVPTGIAMEIPEGWYAQVKSRSGLGSRGLVVTAGVIDSGYRGEIGVVMINTNTASEHARPYGDTNPGYISFRPGDKIAQVVFLPVPEVTLEITDSLNDSHRGENGFGSTG